MSDESIERTAAWFVEFPEAGDSYRNGKRVGPAAPIQWLAIGGGRTTDPNEAMRFCRKQDAESMVAIIDKGPFAFAASGANATEHVFLGAETIPDEDWFEEIISDTLDMDWRPRDAAKAIVRRWNERWYPESSPSQPTGSDTPMEAENG